MASFRKEVVWDHIIKAEEKSFHFVSFMDELFNAKHNYNSRPFAP